MFEVCDPYPTGDGHWRCASCGSAWDEDAGEACPCNSRLKRQPGWRGHVVRLAEALLPRTLFGLVAWTLFGASAVVLVLSGLLMAADRLLRLLLPSLAG